MKNTLKILSFGLGLAAVGFLPSFLDLRAAAAEAGMTGEQRSVRIEAAREEVVTLRSNIFLTLVVLDQVRGEREQAGIRYQAFTNQLGRMEQLARAMGKRTEEMKKRGDAYFQDWEATTSSIQNPEERQQAAKNYSERKNLYDTIGRNMQQAKASFFPFVDELTSIKTMLEGPRDPKRIATARDLFMRANWHCIDVQRALMETEEALDTLAASFAKER